MSYCKYHPLEPATFRCNHCQITSCDSCIDEGPDGSHSRCILCDGDLVNLGASNKAEPFWRRFDKAFRYPMAAPTLTLIAALSFIEALLSRLPIPFISLILGVAVTGMLLKYSFSCLENTARGVMTPPDISEGYGDGIALVFRLILILIAMSAATAGIYTVLGMAAAGLAGVVMTAALPAVIILFAMNDSVLEAINPGNVFRLIFAIGMPYGLLLAIIMIMSSSVHLISQVIGQDFSFVSQVLNSLVSNYYMVVVFHLMGYMLFQYQAELGFTAREEGDETSIERDDKARALAKIKVLIKEGQYDNAAKLFERALKAHPNDNEIHSQYFEFLLAAHGALSDQLENRLSKFTSRYLRFLCKSQRHDSLLSTYKRALSAQPSYQPDTPQLRFLLASACRNSGDQRSALRLLNGLLKEFPDFEDMVPAYQLMADVLDDLPNMEVQAKKCRLLIQKLKQRDKKASGIPPKTQPGLTV